MIVIYYAKKEAMKKKKIQKFSSQGIILCLTATWHSVNASRRSELNKNQLI
jgi:hypothetical protein